MSPDIQMPRRTWEVMKITLRVVFKGAVAYCSQTRKGAFKSW